MKKNKLQTDFLLLFPIMGMFGVIYTNNKWFFIFIDLLLKQSWIDVNTKSIFTEKTSQEIVAQFISPIRGSIFIFCLAFLVVFLFRDLDWDSVRKVVWPGWTTAAMAFFVSALFVFPAGLLGMGYEYAETSLVIFSKVQTINNGERFLLPALAHILFFRGDLFYFVFALICNFLLLYVVLMWFARNNIELNIWQLISLCTVSFISFQFYVPGYPDVLVHIFILLAITLPLQEKGWLVLFALSMATHEASVFIWATLAMFYLKPRSWFKFFIVLGIYILLRFAGGGFDVASAFAPRIVSGYTVHEWLAANPIREFLGILFAFKGLWLIIFTAIYGLIATKQWKETFLVSSLLIAGVIMTFFGIDTSRLAGWAFPALLFSWKFLSTDDHPVRRKIFKIAHFVNLLIPPYYVALNGIDFPRGVYKVIFDKFLKSFIP